ncbi:MAG: methyltransferase domain-containing protein [Balneola sp.]
MYYTDQLNTYKLITNEEVFIADRVWDYVKKYKLKHILDIGTGNGQIMSYLKQKEPELIIDGVDPIQPENSNCFETFFCQKFEEFEFKKKYDLILFSHVFGHFEKPHSKLLCKTIGHSDHVIIVTNAVVKDFEIIQKAIWNYVSDFNYYIELKSLLKPVSNKNINIHKFELELFSSNRNKFYRLLEIFSPRNLPKSPPRILESKIISLFNESSYRLLIPQFLIEINLTKTKTKVITQLNTHQQFWDYAKKIY